MSLNIKNDRVVRKVDFLSSRLGQSKTSVIETALDRLIGELNEQHHAAKVSQQEEISEVLSLIRSNIYPTGLNSSQVQAEMYDKAGLPLW